MRTLLITLLLVAGWATGQTFFDVLTTPDSLNTADGVHYYTMIAGEVGWTDPNWDQLTFFLSGETNAGGEAVDTSGQTPTPGAVLGPTYTVLGTNTDSSAYHFGRVKYCWSFDGVDDTIVFPIETNVNSSLHMYMYDAATNRSFAQSVWVKAINTNGLQVGWCGGDYNNTEYMIMTVRDGVTQAGWDNNAFWPWAYGIPATTAPQADEWTHLCYVSHLSFTNFYVTSTLYINGAFNSSASYEASASGNAPTISDLIIGNWGSAYPFGGLLSDIRFYKGPGADETVVLDATAVSNLWWNTGGKYTNQPWMSNENY